MEINSCYTDFVLQMRRLKHVDKQLRYIALCKVLPINNGGCLYRAKRA